MIDARMKIRHLQCFMEVARLGHVGRAADQLAVFKTPRELEEFLNVRLFTRGPKASDGRISIRIYRSMHGEPCR